MRRIAPSILAADFSDLYGDVSQVEGSVDLLHLDVMDGQFVPNISFGQPVIASLRERTDLYFDTHLMIERPSRYVEDFASVGVDRLTVHVEAREDTRAIVEEIHDHDMDAGVALNPDTDIEAIEPLLDTVDMVLVMSVQPGFGGQSFEPETLDRVERIAEQTDTEIEVDGGVDEETGPRCAEAGVDTFVIGSSLFGREDIPGALTELRESIGIDDG
ncbi:ribulose-phosphate 3-epimerase [Halorhabdus amylolytica]|uniref:ribulose-phosphate 3-epimerase n=1 Tax=Halorhabdus amylolytica TaxID=2559573 RepID=UPI0010AA78C4|nr:ribulose-phosphate 3-epimerase [Halorhabdus amylolytica]